MNSGAAVIMISSLLSCSLIRGDSSEANVSNEEELLIEEVDLETLKAIDVVLQQSPSRFKRAECYTVDVYRTSVGWRIAFVQQQKVLKKQMPPCARGVSYEINKQFVVTRRVLHRH